MTCTSSMIPAIWIRMGAFWSIRRVGGRDPNPERPGERVSILSYHSTPAQELCPCGSGNRFSACCRPLPYWQLVCPNPDMQGYNLVRPQSARFTTLPADAVYAFLREDERLYCVEDTPRRAFWTYWGKPAFDIPQGRLCFGDIELLESRTLLITTLSDARMEVLLELVRPLNLGTPQMQLDSSHVWRSRYGKYQEGNADVDPEQER